MALEAQDVKKNKMLRLSSGQLDIKEDFVKQYCGAGNAADGSTFDPNSNVVIKNIATLAAELNKDINIQVKRRLVTSQMKEMFGPLCAEEYISQLESHLIYAHDETALSPYCCAVTVYPFLLDGLKGFGGESKAPKHLSSFNGGFVNLIFALSSQFAGAVAAVEYLAFFDWFARKDFGGGYLETHPDVIEQELQQVMYALNQPAAARGFQSVFFNLSVFDKYYFDALLGNTVMPDGSKLVWESVSKLQKFFLKWFNKERTRALLTFPVVTVALLNDGKDIVDREYAEFTAEQLAEGNAFFVYTSDTVDSLSSCCRLRSAIKDQLNNKKNNDFSYSLGAGGIQTGSMNVLTLNANRFIQDTLRDEPYVEEVHLPILLERLKEQIRKMHQYQMGFRSLFKIFEKHHMLSAYDAGFISLDKQYLTIGINGLMEGAEYLGYTPSNNDKYKYFLSVFLKTVSDINRQSAKEFGVKFNTEMVPAESLGVKFANWDKKDGYVVPRDCYNSYFYPVEDEKLTILDKFAMHGSDVTGYLDGGSALHLNLEDYPDEGTFLKILKVAVQSGCNYFCTNVKVTICNKCGHIGKRTLGYCEKCGSKDIDYATRIIGYLRRVSNFSKERREEESRRRYHRI